MAETTEQKLENTKKVKEPSIKKNFILSTLYEILCVISPFITAPYASRVLGAVNIGIYSYTSSIEMYFSLIAVMGTASYGAREIARTRDDKYLNSKIFWEIELLSVITSIVALIGWGIFVFFSKQYKLYFLILTINIFSKMFDISWFYRGLEQFKYTVSRNSIVKIVGIVCLFVFVKKPEDLWIYFCFHVGVALLGNMSMWLSLHRFLVKVNPKEFKILHHFKETLVYFIPAIATSIYTVLDKTLIGIITKDPKQNGYYEQATKLINIVKALCFSSLNSVLGVRTSYLYEQKKYDEVKEKINLAIQYIMFMSIPCCFGLIGIASDFVPIFFGNGYESSIFILQLLSPVIILTGIGNCLGGLYYIPAGLRIKSALFLVIGSFVNLILNLILIPRFTTTGAVIGTLVGETIITTLYVLFCDHFYTFKQLFKSSYKNLISSTIMLLCIFLIKFYLPISNRVIVLIIEISVAIVIYFVILIVLKDRFLYIVFDKFKNKFLKRKKVVKL